LASLRPGLVQYLDELKGVQVLDGNFMNVKQAIGIPLGYPKCKYNYLNQFVEGAKEVGSIKALVDRHNVIGLIIDSDMSLLL